MKWSPAIRAACAATCVAGLVSHSRGALSYDLRFFGGTHEIIPIHPNVYTVELWARVSGTNATQTDEGLTNSYVTILSSQIAGGSITSGGLTAASLGNGFNETGSRVGASADLNNDGVLDWGATVTAVANTSYMLVRNGTIGGAVAGGTLGQAVNPFTWEFKIATFTLSVPGPGPGAGGQTRFDVVQPNAKAVVGTMTYAVGRVDGSTFNITSANTQNAYPSRSGILLGASDLPPYYFWDGGPTGGGNQWLNADNWSPETSPFGGGPGGIPSGSNIATFNDGTASTIGIDFAGATNNGPANQQIGQILIETRSVTIQNSSTTPGTLTINGANFIDPKSLNNSTSDKTLTLANGSAPMTVLLKNGVVGTGTSPAARIVIDATLTTAPGMNLTVVGQGRLTLSGNSILNEVDVKQGTLEVTPTGNLTAPVLRVGTGFNQVIATLRNDGTISAPVIAGLTSVVSGSGNYNAITLNPGSTISPGNSVGLLTCTSLTMGSSAGYVFELQSPASTDQIDVNGTLNITAGMTASTKFSIKLQTLDGAGGIGPMTGFNPSLAYQWVLAESNGIASVASLGDRFSVDTTGFNNPLNGNFFVSQSGNDLMLNYQPVPEPGAVVGAAVALGAGLLGRRRR
jgi:hypothetical protein